MNEKRAVKLAIEALQREAQRLAVDANLHDLYRLDTAHAVNASKRRKEVLEAIDVLRGKLTERSD